MKRATPKENTLFNYYKKLKDPKAETTSLSTLIEKTSTTTTLQVKKNTTTPIDLTLDDDNDIIMIPSSPLSENIQLISSQNSVSSFGSRERVHNEVITNTSKYNNKGWSAFAKERGPQVSSQETPSQEKKSTIQKFERIVLKKSRSVSKPSVQWLGENDVKPYSSNYTPYTMADTVKKPAITLAHTGHNKSTSEKRKWNDDLSVIDNALGNADAARFWNEFNNKKKRVEADFTKMNQFSFTTRPKLNQGNNSFNRSSSPNKNKSKQEYQPELSDEQERVLNMVLHEKKSLFFTGSAGTGKSVLLRAIIDKLGEKYGSQLAVTASTGIAACNITGCTLHSFAGIGIGKESGAVLANKIKFDNKRAKERWMGTKVLVIDEISMVDAELFDKLDLIAKTVRSNPLPFGGIQLIVTGDFFQLPPVSVTYSSKFAFEAKTWPITITQTVMLTKVFRQKDGTFVQMLNEMRLGFLSREAILKFKSLSSPPQDNDGIKPTELYPLRYEVEQSNKKRLDELKGEPVTFTAIDSGDSRKMQSCIAPQTMVLKIDAQVMLLKNMDIDLVNGSIGVVVGFVGKGQFQKKEKVARLRTPNRLKDSFIEDNEIDMTIPFPIVKFTGGRLVVLEHETWSIELPGGRDAASRQQIPLMLAWAISIHKSQGQTLDRVKVDLGRVFEKGQAYVALSRATSLDRLQILNFDENKVKAHPTVTHFYKSLKTI